ncbi:GRAS domain-containing protein [Forsythia ovata]|uniref:GRAS domain-containing protein n=1 Tax=Forsythia ovata TaxID=205694 RepID=A0ABD1P760_9LAMI
MSGTRSSCQVLSAESIMKIARKGFLVLASQKTENFSESGDSYENQRGGELVLRLLVAEEKFSNEQFDRAEQLLVGCYFVPSTVFFAQAPLERISKEKCRINIQRNSMDVEVLINLQPSGKSHKYQEMVYFWALVS